MNAATPPVLRPATAADAAIALAWTPVAADLRRWAGPDMPFPISPEEFWQKIAARPVAPHVLESAADGVVAFGHIGRREPDCGHLARLIVSPAHRGRGFGRLLCLALMREALRLTPPIRAFTLYVLPDNAPAIGLYRSLGFADREFDARYGCMLMEAPLSALPPD